MEKTTDKGYNIRKPPRIIHAGRPIDVFPAMARDAAKNVNLPPRATDLFLYLTAQSSEFRPALKTIANSIRIAETEISRVRKTVCERGLMFYGKYKGDTVYYFDWRKIKVFAMLEEPLPRNGIYSRMIIDDDLPFAENKVMALKRIYKDEKSADKVYLEKEWTKFWIVFNQMTYPEILLFNAEMQRFYARATKHTLTE